MDRFIGPLHPDRRAHGRPGRWRRLRVNLLHVGSGARPRGVHVRTGATTVRLCLSALPPAGGHSGCHHSARERLGLSLQCRARPQLLACALLYGRMEPEEQRRLSHAAGRLHGMAHSADRHCHVPESLGPRPYWLGTGHAPHCGVSAPGRDDRPDVLSSPGSGRHGIRPRCSGLRAAKPVARCRHPRRPRRGDAAIRSPCRNSPLRHCARAGALALHGSRGPRHDRHHHAGHRLQFQPLGPP